MRPWLVVAVLWVVAFLNYLDRQIIFSLFPLLESDLHLQGVQLGLLSMAFLWVYGAVSPLAGFWADRTSKRTIIVLSLAIWSTITFATGLAANFGQLVTARALMGLSEAFYLPAALALINALHTDRTRGLATGIHQSGLYVGLISGGWLGGWLGQHYGWRFPFGALGGIGLAYTLIAWRVLPVDYRTVVSQPIGFLASLPKLLRCPGYPSIALAFGLKGLADWSIYTWLPVFLYERFHMDLTTAGFQATFFPQIASLGGILMGGYLGDQFRRFPRARLYVQVAGLLLSAPFVASLAYLNNQLWLPAALLSLGIGKGMYDANAMPTLTQVVPVELRATAFGWMNSLSCLVGGLSALFGGVMRQYFTLDLTFLLGAATLVVCGLLLLRVKPAPAP